MIEVYKTRNKYWSYQARKSFNCNCGLVHWTYALGKNKKQAIKNLEK